MPFVEGKGLVAPAFVDVILPKLIVHKAVQRGLNQECKNQYHRNSYGWKKGFIENPTGKGLGGEFAVAQHINSLVPWANVKVDTEDKDGGDGDRDIDILGLTIQVKTRTTANMRRKKVNYVRHVTSSGRELKNDCRRYVFCEWEYPKMPIRILGFVTGESLRDCLVEKSDHDAHLNYVIRDCDLEPTSRLITDIRSIRKWSNAN